MWPTLSGHGFGCRIGAWWVPWPQWWSLSNRARYSLEMWSQVIDWNGDVSDWVALSYPKPNTWQAEGIYISSMTLLQVPSSRRSPRPSLPERWNLSRDICVGERSRGQLAFHSGTWYLVDAKVLDVSNFFYRLQARIGSNFELHMVLELHLELGYFLAKYF